MRLAWAIVAGVVAAGALYWWQARDATQSGAPEEASAGSGATADTRRAAAPQGQTLYRWRDDAGVMQVTDIPPEGRDYTLVDVSALERRNTIHPDPMVTEAR